jgi:hypothetical protein
LSNVLEMALNIIVRVERVEGEYTVSGSRRESRKLKAERRENNENESRCKE